MGDKTDNDPVGRFLDLPERTRLLIVLAGMAIVALFIFLIAAQPKESTPLSGAEPTAAPSASETLDAPPAPLPAAGEVALPLSQTAIDGQLAAAVDTLTVLTNPNLTKAEKNAQTARYVLSPQARGYHPVAGAQQPLPRIAVDKYLYLGERNTELLVDVDGKPHHVLFTLTSAGSWKIIDVNTSGCQTGVACFGTDFVKPMR